MGMEQIEHVLAADPFSGRFFADALSGVRSGKWKLMFPQSYYTADPPGKDGLPGGMGRRQIPKSLFDLEADPGETTNLVDQYPDVVKRLEALAEAVREELGDGPERKGRGVRPVGR